MDVTNDFQSSGINQGPGFGGFGGFGVDLRGRRGGSKKYLRSIQKEIFRSREIIADKICDLSKDCQKDAYEIRIDIAGTRADVVKELLENKYELAKEIVASRFEAHKQVDALSKQVSDGFNDLKVDGVKDKLEAAINELNALRGQANTATLLSAIQGHWHGKC